MKILCIDIESVPKSIVEIAMVELDTETKEKRVMFSSVCHQPFQMVQLALYETSKKDILLAGDVEDGWIVRNSTLTTEMIMSSPTVDSLKDEIQATLNRYTDISAYFATFDINALQNIGIEFSHEVYDPFDHIKTKFVDAYTQTFNDFSYKQTHRAIQDAWDLAELLSVEVDNINPYPWIT